jgi:ribulose 1,5-bisphosphate synthetase/thiazole synthase
MEYISIDEKLQIPIILEADVVVIGAGPGGLGAALFSAQNGAKTVVVERYGVPGGMAVVAEVTPFMCSYYQNEVLDYPVYGQWRNAMNKYLPNQISNYRKENIESYAGRGIHKEAAALAAEDLLLENNVEILYHHQVTGVVKEGRKIVAIRCHFNGQEVAIKGKCFVDCSGDGELASLAGCNYSIGNENGQCQPMTLCFKLSHVKTNWSDYKDDSRIFELRKLLNDKYTQAVARGEIVCPRENVLLFPFELCDDNVVHFNTTRVVGANPVDGKSFSQAEIEGRRQLRDIYFWLKKEIPEFAEARLMSMGVQIGVRESRHIEGINKITVDNFRNKSKFDDAIARCAYAIDIHNPTGSGTVIETIGKDNYYEIPYGCIVAKDVDNLTIGGRPISADAAIHSSFRIMPTAISIGQAAGLAASIAALSNTLPKDLDGKAVRAKLVEMGARL